MGRPAEAPPSPAAPHQPPFVTLGELVAGVADGSRVGVGGALLTRLPLAAVHALAARQPRDLVYVSWGGGLPLEILLGAGAVSRIVFCFSSLDIFGLAPLFRRAVEDRQVVIDEWPAYAFTARLEAAKQNLPAMPFRLPRGSDLLAGQEAVTLPGPEQDPAVAEASRLDLDVFLLHAQRADAAGNVEIAGSRGMDTTAAFAARQVLVTVEEVVPTGVLGTLRNSFVLPRHFVHALSVVPGGAYPTSCLPSYTADFARLAQVTAQSPPPPAAPGPAELTRLREAAALTHDAVAAAVRQVAAAHRTRGAAPEPASDDGTATPDEPASVDELMVCWLARQLTSESICAAGAVSPLAATSYLLAKATHAPGLAILMTSGGLLDVAVRPMLLSLGEALDVASAVAQCGGEDSYRWYYQQGRVSCEVVTAAQIDRRARTNNVEVTSPSGRRVRLPGQGGMADVADLHQNFILYLTRQSPLSLVQLGRAGQRGPIAVQRGRAAARGAAARRGPADHQPRRVRLLRAARRAGPAEPAPGSQPGRPARGDRVRAGRGRRPGRDRGALGRDAPGAARGDRPAGDPPAGVRPRPGACRAAGRVHRRGAGPHRPGPVPEPEARRRAARKGVSTW